MLSERGVRFVGILKVSLRKTRVHFVGILKVVLRERSVHLCPKDVRDSVQVVFGDATGAVLCTLWPPSSRFQSVLWDALTNGEEGKFPKVVLTAFEVRHAGSGIGKICLKLSGGEGSLIVDRWIFSSCDFTQPSPLTYADDFSHVADWKAGMRGAGVRCWWALN